VSGPYRCAADPAIGFSRNTCLPASRSSSAWSRCRECGPRC